MRGRMIGLARSSRGIAAAVRASVMALAVSACATLPDTSDPQPLAAAFEPSVQSGDPFDPVYSNYFAATLAASEAEYRRAAGFFSRAVAAAPQSAHVAERAFFGLVYAGEIEDALKVAVRINEQTPEAVDDLVRMIYALDAFVEEDWQGVIARIETARAEGFGYIINPIFAAWAYTMIGELDQARAHLSPLLESPSLRPVGLEFWAYILEQSGHLAEAETVYRDLVDSNRLPSLQPLVSLAHLMVRTGRKEQARQFLGEQLERFKSNAFLRREAHRTLFMGGPSHRPRDPMGAAGLIFFRLGSELAQGESAEGAIIYLQIARFLAPHVADVHILLGTILERLDHHGEAARAYASVPKTDPSYGAALMRRIEALRRSGEPDAAIQLAEEALLKRPNNRALKTVVADLYRGQERFPEAITVYSDLISSLARPQTTDWWLYFARGISLEQSGDWARAQADLLTAMKLNPEQPDVLNYLGYSWVDRGLNIQEAKGMIEKAVAARPEDGMVIDSLGWVHFLTGAYEEAILHLEKAVSLEPTDSVINAHLGDAYWKVGRRLEARFQWRHALDMGPDSEEARALLKDKIAYGLELASDFEGARLAKASW